ncbi:MAG: Lrp/AsnC ligand binding domain-containing protein [Candidatus Lokiarchaeota archaeon]|nr:Lrp/AsnC ligand binding domain-containing protein [Candidatus Lokiarchaeota archaeon]
MTIKALIFCKISHNSMLDVVNRFNEISEIKKVFSLTGDYDICAEIEVDKPEELYNSFAKKIDLIEGILNTNTHVVMKEFIK